MNSDILKTLDQSKFGWLHIKAIIVSGTGFLTDSYDVFVVNLITSMIAKTYFDGHLSPFQDGLLKTSASVGTLVGQLLFGYMSDKYGRKKMYGLELVLIIIGTFGAAVSGMPARGWDIIAMISIWRFIMGIGIGGDYPVSAASQRDLVMTSEYATTNNRGAMMSAVFAMQGVGIFLASCVCLIVLVSFSNLINADILNIDYVWRICLGFGILPALCAVYFRLRIPETPRFTLHVQGDEEKAINDINEIKVKFTKPDQEEHDIGSDDSLEPTFKGKITFKSYFSQQRNLKVLLGCSISWFALDVAFYGLQLNQSVVLQSMGYINTSGTPYEQFYDQIVGNVLLAVFGSIPGYWMSVFLIDKIGRLTIQRLGFLMLTVILFSLGLFETFFTENKVAFSIVYGFGMFFFNFGPNTTTFVLPGEVFPTRFRSTGHGISAASGKLGAMISTALTPWLRQSFGMNVVFYLYAALMAVGLFVTNWIPETKCKSLEELTDHTLELKQVK